MSVQRSKYRFTVGTRVLCKTSPTEWSAGEIISLDYTEPRLEGQIMPYQVQLDDGSEIFVPSDVVQLCRLLVPPWWAKVFAFASESFFCDESSGEVIRLALEKIPDEIQASYSLSQVPRVQK